MFPSMLGFPGEKSSEQELQGLWTMEEGEQANAQEGGFTVILTPVEEKDKIIEEQNSKIKILQDKQGEMPSLQEALAKTETENMLLKKKLSFTKRATEQKIFDNISNEEYYREDPHLVCVLSAALEEEFELVENYPNTSEKLPTSPKLIHRSRRDKFLSSIEDKVDKNNSTHQERLSHIKNEVLDRIKSTKIRRLQARTDSVSSSVGSKRRLSFSTDDQAGRSPSRPRTVPPAPRS